MQFEPNSMRAAASLVIAGAAWPSTLCLLTELAMSPYQRALRAAWCGAGAPTLEFVGHCSACWAGAGALLGAAAIAAAATSRSGARPTLRMAYRE